MNRPDPKRINDHIANLDIVACNRRLLDIVGKQQRNHLTYTEISNITNIPEDRLTFLIGRKRPLMYREEFMALASGTATAFDELFQIPKDLATTEAVQACLGKYEYRD